MNKEERQTKLRKEMRKKRIRSRIYGTDKRPRLTVSTSHRSVSAQLIDDIKGNTIAAANSLKSSSKNLNEQAVQTGSAIAEAALKAGIKQVVFDRNGHPYHGRIKALAEAARAKGLEF